MSKRHKSSRLRGLAIFLALVALVYGAYQTQKQLRSKPSLNTRDSDLVYRDTSWMYKVKIRFAPLASTDLTKIYSLLDKYITETPVHSHESGATGLYVVKVPNESLPEFKRELSSLGSILETSASTDTSLVSTSVDIENQKLLSYQTERATLDDIRVRSEIENRRMDTLNRLIRQTLDKLERLQASDTSLLYLIVSPATSSSNPLSLAKTFVKHFLISLVALLIAAALVYFGTRLLMTLLAMLGVKGFGLENVLQNYSYKSYGSYGGKYGYGYSSKRNRKVKRVYKDKPSTTTEDKSQDDK